MRIKILYIFIFIYFFINNFGLPHGLLYTSLLFPVFYIFLVSQRQQLIISKFLLLVTPYIVIHFIYGVDVYYYIRSLILAFTTYIFIYASYICVKKYQGWEKVFDWLIKVNFVFVVLALLFLFTPLKDIFWAGWWISPSVGFVPRLKLLNYEPSYYSTLLVPLVAFYILKLMYHPKRQSTWIQVIILSLSLVLSFSVGVMGGLVLAFICFFIFNLFIGIRQANIYKVFILIFSLSMIGLLVITVVYPQNPLFLRLYDIVSLNDNSGSGRTFDSAVLAYDIAKQKSIWFGVGFGQIKIVGDEIYRDFYNLSVEIFPEIVPTIPNTLAETFTLFGITGLFIRFMFIFYFSYKAKVWKNHYQLILFIYAFIYQFTGSYYINTAEYMIWIFTFTNCFPQFDRNLSITRQKNFNVIHKKNL